MKFGQWLGLIVLMVSLYILWQLRQVLLLVFLSVILATALNRVAKRFRRSGTKRSIAAILAVVITLSLVVVLIGVIIPPFISQVDQLVELVPVGLSRLEAWFTSVQNQIPGLEPGDALPLGSLMQQAQPFANWAFGNFFSLFSNVLSTGLSLLLVLVLTVMFLIKPAPYRQGFLLLFPAFYRRRADEILTRCEVSLVGWMRGVLIDMVVIGLISGIGLQLLGVALPLANGALAGLLEAIPNIGPTLSLIPPTAIALLDSPWKALGVLIFYFLLQQLEGFFLVPYVMASQVSLLPAVTLLSQIVFALFFGFLGLLLAIPLVVVGQIWIHEALIKDVLNEWRGTETPSDPASSSTQEPTYSRL